MTDNETKYHCYRICRAAGLPERGWHNLRHAFGTHAALFGVNPWKLMSGWATSASMRRCSTSISRRLREWGTGIAYPLPPNHRTSILGAAPDCWVRLWDPIGRISRKHAELAYGEDGWAISDLGSKNGVHVDGVRVASCSLTPGAEIRIGPVTLIAESPKLIALRSLLERLIGWGEDRREEIDRALFSVRIAATRREPLLLCGAGNLVPIARLLHQHAMADRPFVTLKPGTPGMETLAAVGLTRFRGHRTRLHSLVA
jgi:hypothetical protein